MTGQGTAIQDDAELMRRIADGDERAYERLVDAHARRILAFGFRLLGTREEAEEVTQETFLRAWQHADRYEPSARVTTWLHTIARNVATDRLRKRRPRADLAALEGAPDAAVDSGHRVGQPGVYLERKQTAQTVAEALAQLAPRQREAIALVHYQGLSHGEAAEVLGVGVEAVESLLARARRKLRELLGGVAGSAR